MTGNGNGRLAMPLLVQGDARNLPLADGSVDLIVTSPPYWSLRDYRDNGESCAGQIGSEPTWQEYLDNLIDCTREWMRVLKPTGSCWVNLGDKYSGAQAQNFGGTSRAGDSAKVWARTDPKRTGIPNKSLLNLPHRYAIRCVDELGLILRQDQVWEKANGLPESVVDRTRRSHEYLFHLVKSPRYYSAVDEIREPHAEPDGRPGYGRERPAAPGGNRGRHVGRMDHAAHRDMGQNALGKLPGSVWEIASQPLNVPDRVSHARCCDGRKRAGCVDGLDHYAAFPMELARRVVRGWSPREVCNACGEGRRPVLSVIRPVEQTRRQSGLASGQVTRATMSGGTTPTTMGANAVDVSRTITGYACACPDTSAPSTPGVVVDPFGGTGTTSLVAAMHGRLGISVDRSWDYCDGLARWRVNDPKERARAAGLDAAVVARVPVMAPSQVSLFDGTAS